MPNERTNTRADSEKPSWRKKTIDLLMKIGAGFIILEPVWMLLPFAGFLYGSVMHIQLMSRNPYTSWLVHFVLPTHTLFPLGLILMVLAMAVFVVGAIQIYAAKLLKKGLVSTGIYRYFRHPQYLSLTIFGIGILLTWGRFITYIAFFVMMWLYYFLSQSEERKCLGLFGDEYAEYRRNSFFLFPGESTLMALSRKVFHFDAPKWAKRTISFALVIGLAVGSGLLIQVAKGKLCGFPEVIQGAMALSKDGTRKVNLVMVKGPALQAAPSDTARHQFMGRAFEMIVSSQKIKEALSRIDLDEKHTVVAFLTPAGGWHSADHRDHRTAKVNAYMVAALPTGNLNGEYVFKDTSSMRFLKSIKVEGLSYARLENGQDPAEGSVTVSGPPTGTMDGFFQNRVRRRISFFVSGL